MSPTRREILEIKHGDEIAGRYRIISAAANPASGELAEALGEGGSGVVFRASQRLHEDVTVLRAVKFFVYRDDLVDEHGMSGPVGASSFSHEIENISGFNHQNLAKVVEAGFWASPQGTEVPYLVSELIEGPDLRQVCERKQLLEILGGDDRRLIGLLMQLCDGLQHLHSRRFYHCDLAPKNVFVQKRGGDQPHLILGDLGAGTSLPRDQEEGARAIRLVGTKSYSPPEVVNRLNQQVTLAEYAQLQPWWDMFALLRVGKALAEALIDELASPPDPWLRALARLLDESIKSRRFGTVEALADWVKWLDPTRHTVAGIPETTESAPAIQRKIIPVEAAGTSHRVRLLLRHSRLSRLRYVPQLFLGSTIFPGANHTRFEHTLGTYQAMRRYLLAFMSDEEFLAVVSPPHFELALVAALLSSSSRYAFSWVIDELAKPDIPGSAALQAHKSSLIHRILTETDAPGEHPLSTLLEQEFERVDLDSLERVLSPAKLVTEDKGERLVHFLLHSSVGARVVDYLRRDAHHLGLGQGDSLELGELLESLRVNEYRVEILPGGVSVVERLLSLRYRLHERAYWNQPNRCLIAMVRRLLVGLMGSAPEFGKQLVVEAWTGSEQSVLAFLHAKALEVADPVLVHLSDALDRPYAELFREILAGNTHEDSTNGEICAGLARLSAAAVCGLEVRLQKKAAAQFSHPDLILIIDYPNESERWKLGEDLDVRHHDGRRESLAEFSPIVKGIKVAVQQKLQRVRVFIDQASHKGLEKRLPELRDFVRRELRDDL